MKRVIVEHLGLVDYSDMKVPMAVIYQNVIEAPGKIVVRLWEAALNRPTNIEVHSNTLNEARKAIAMSGLMPVCFPRCENDEPEIIEWWI